MYPSEFELGNPALRIRGTFTSRTLATDYDNYLVNYLCDEEDDQGYCPSEKMNIDVLVSDM